MMMDTRFLLFAESVEENVPKMSISNFKLGEQPPGGHPRIGSDDCDPKEEEVEDKKCLQKQIKNITCPDPHINFYLYSG
jgi:hypothetical protein